MAIEIERKFLVYKTLWAALEKPAGVLFRQGYITTDPAKTIRIRITDDEAWLTIKGTTTGASRTEIECRIDRATAAEMLKAFAVSEISKRRYEIPFGGKIWEVDEFLDDNEGLLVAEFELTHEAAFFEKPDWILEEVTQDSRYYNAALSLHPFKQWDQ